VKETSGGFLTEKERVVEENEMTNFIDIVIFMRFNLVLVHKVRK